MSYNGSGTFSINTAGQPVVTGTVITSTAFNALTADLANGLSTALCKDGQSTPTANIGLGNFKITSLGNGTAATDAVNLSQVQSSAASYLSVSGADTIIATASPALTAYAAGNVFYFAAAGTNTGAVTLNIDGLGAKAITRDGSTALVAGDLVANSEVVVVYDGTRFQVLNSNSKTNFNLSGTLTAASTATATKFIPTGGTATGNGMYLPTTNTLAWSTNSSERMRLDSSGNLGIGTTNPVTKLNVASADGSPTGINVGGIRVYETTNNYGLNISGDSTYGYIQGLRGATSTTGYNDLVLQPNSGNVGIGVTPVYRLDVVQDQNASTYIRSRNSDTGSSAYAGFLVNAYGNNWAMRMGSSAANSNALQIVQDALGTPAVRATFDTSGNLGIGVTPSAWSGVGAALQVGTSAAIIGNSVNSSSFISNAYFDGTNYKYIGTGFAQRLSFTSGAYSFQTAASGTAGNTVSFTASMTLDASGNLALGGTTNKITGLSGGGNGLTIQGATAPTLALYDTTNAGYYLNLGQIETDSYLWNIATGIMSFGTNNTERARITSGGEVYIAGTTDQGAYNLQVNGTGVWGAGAYVNGSDERLKDNIQTLDDGLAVVSQLRPVTFQYKSDYSKDRSVQPGFIAQELQQAMANKPYLDGVVQSGPKHLNVAYQNLIPILTKAIQEQQSIINDLRSRVAQLETK